MFITLEALEDGPLQFDEVFAANEIDYAVEGLRQTAPLHIQGTASAIQREIHVRGDLSTMVESECARCLDLVSLPVKREFDLYYQPLVERPEAEELLVPKGEEELGFYSGEGLLLEDVAKEQVLLSLPMRAICREQCKGLCPTCGINRNRETCECKATDGDPRWAALKNI